MTAIENPPTGIPVIASVWRTYRDTLGKPRSLITVAALPSLVTVAGLFVAANLPVWEHPLRALFVAPFILPLCYLSLAWLRHSLFAVPARFRIQGIRLASYGKLLGHWLLWLVLVWTLPAGLVIGTVKLLISMVDGPWEYSSYLSDGVIVGFAWLGLTVLATVPASRLFFAAPAIATGQPASPLAAWRSSQGQGLRLGLALVLLTISLLVLETLALCAFLICALGAVSISGVGQSFLQPYDIGEGAAIVLLVVDTLLRTILASELIAIAYRHATGWEAKRQEILERFE